MAIWTKEFSKGMDGEELEEQVGDGLEEQARDAEELDVDVEEAIVEWVAAEHTILVATTIMPVLIVWDKCTLLSDILYITLGGLVNIVIIEAAALDFIILYSFVNILSIQLVIN